jgi:hypothetical protein
MPPVVNVAGCIATLGQMAALAPLARIRWQESCRRPNGCDTASHASRENGAFDGGDLPRDGGYPSRKQGPRCRPKSSERLQRNEMSRPPKPPSTRTRVKRSRALSVRRDGTDATDGQRSEGGRLVIPTVQCGTFDPAVQASTRMLHEQLERMKDFTPQSPKRSRTILLVEGRNELTGRDVRVYIRPDDTLVMCETLGQLERTR